MEFSDINQLTSFASSDKDKYHPEDIEVTIKGLSSGREVTIKQVKLIKAEMVDFITGQLDISLIHR